MKKNLKHSLIAVLITLSLIVTVGIAVVAASTETDVASFEKADGSVVYFDSLEEAVTTAKSEAKKVNDTYTVTVHKNASLSNSILLDSAHLILRSDKTGSARPTITANITSTHKGVFTAYSANKNLTIENLKFVINGTSQDSVLILLNDKTNKTHDFTFTNVDVSSKKDFMYCYVTDGAATYNITIEGGTWTSADANGVIANARYKNQSGSLIGGGAETGNGQPVSGRVDFNMTVSNMTLKAGIYHGHNGYVGTESNRSTFTNVTIDSKWYLVIPVGTNYTHSYLKFDNCTVNTNAKAIAGSGSQNTKNNIIDIVATNTSFKNDGTNPLFVNTANIIKFQMNGGLLESTNAVFGNNASRADNRFSIKLVDVNYKVPMLLNSTKYPTATDITSVYVDNLTKADGYNQLFELNPKCKTSCDIIILNCTKENVKLGELGGRFSVYTDSSSANKLDVVGSCFSSPYTFDTDKGKIDGIFFGFSITKPIEDYMAANPNAPKHTITKSHKVVYPDSAYFIDAVNGTGSYFSCYAKTGAASIRTTLGNMGTTITEISDKTAASGREILVGIVDRSATNSFLPGLDVNEYGIKVTANEIILLAWHDSALKLCVESFVGYLSNKNLSLPVGFEFIGIADSDWKVDFARPEDTTLIAGQYVNDEAIQFVYTGNGATNAGYKAYCNQLVSEGFTLVWTNTIGNNEFRMYKNETKETALYVAYNDYTYGEGITPTEDLPGDYTKCIRIVSSPLSAILLPDDTDHKFGAPQSYNKVTDSYVATLGITEGNVGTGHIIMLEDGSFIVVDGGNCKTKNGSSYSYCKDGVWCEHVALIWDSLNNLYEKAYGHKPTTSEPIRISAWYLTHAHDDHYTAFYNMLKLIDSDASKKAIFEIDYVIANLPGENSLLESSSATWGFSGGFDNMKKLLGGIDVIKVHTGQKLYFANLTIEILMTFEDHLPFRINNSNDTNTITRFNIASGDKSTSIMFLGDAWRPTSRFLCAMYGKYLKSDISQVSHHGNIGAEKELYEMISPSTILFNNTFTMFQKYAWARTNSKNPETVRAYAVSKFAVRELASVKYVFNAVEGMCPTFKISAAGVEYDSAFDLVTEKALTFITSTASGADQNGFINKDGVELHEHDYKLVILNEVYHQYECECGSVSKMEEHTAAENNDCTIATKCTVCGHTMSEAKDAHTPNADGSKCEDCGTSLLTDTTDKITDTTPNTDTTKEKGCGSMISVAGLALVASLGACAIFVEKKRK